MFMNVEKRPKRCGRGSLHVKTDTIPGRESIRKMNLVKFYLIMLKRILSHRGIASAKYLWSFWQLTDGDLSFTPSD
jgi:hypothetical protein